MELCDTTAPSIFFASWVWAPPMREPAGRRPCGARAEAGRRIRPATSAGCRHRRSDRKPDEPSGSSREPPRRCPRGIRDAAGRRKGGGRKAFHGNAGRMRRASGRYIQQWRRDQASPSFAPMPEELGVRVFDVMHDILTRRSVACVTQRRAPGALTTTETNWEGLRWH